MFKYLRFLIAVGTFLTLSVNVNTQEILQVKGSDTLINLVQILAERYLELNPKKYIAVTGGGSGTGIAALINGKCDIANASRLMKPEEITQCRKNGVDPKSVIIAIDGLSLITNIKNSLDKLTMDDVGKIFRGEIVNWKDVGGRDLSITLYGRQSNSGTFVFFRDAVLKGDYSQKMKQMNGNAQIAEAVKQDISGIGYVGVGYIKEITGINVIKVASSVKTEYVNPLNSEDVKSGKYPISRPLNQYVNGTPKGAVRDFILFELGQKGQKIVEEQGFFPISDYYRELNRKTIPNLFKDKNL